LELNKINTEDRVIDPGVFNKTIIIVLLRLGGFKLLIIKPTQCYVRLWLSIPLYAARTNRILLLIIIMAYQCVILQKR